MAKEARRPRDDDEDDEDDKPRKKRRDDDEDEAPRKKHRDDDADDYDDRPAKKKKKVGAVGKIIPYKNGAALAAYYCGVFGLIPILGFLLGPIAAVLGILGMAKAKNMTEGKGTGHAIAGIVLGIIDVILWPILWMTFLRELSK